MVKAEKGGWGIPPRDDHIAEYLQKKGKKRCARDVKRGEAGNSTKEDVKGRETDAVQKSEVEW